MGKVYTILSWNWPIPTFTFYTRFGWEKNGESVLSLYTQEDRGTVVTHLLLLVYLLSYLFSVKKKPGMQVELCPQTEICELTYLEIGPLQIKSNLIRTYWIGVGSIQ